MIVDPGWLIFGLLIVAFAFIYYRLGRILMELERVRAEQRRRRLQRDADEDR